MFLKAGQRAADCRPRLSGGPETWWPSPFFPQLFCPAVNISARMSLNSFTVLIIISVLFDPFFVACCMLTKPGPKERKFIFSVVTGAIIGDGDCKSWDARGPMIWDNFSIFRTNCAILTSYIRANPRTCRGFSRGCCHVAGSNVESC